MNIIFLGNGKEHFYRAYTTEQMKDYPVLNYDEVISQKVDTKKVEYIFSTWGMPSLSEEEITKFFPDLKIVFYGAGTVQQFARPFLNSGVRVFSAWAANAVPVAEFTVAQIILANKGYFQLPKRYKEVNNKSKEYAETFCGNYDVSVGLLGAGMIGKNVVELLSPFNMNIKIFDPFLSEEKAKELGVEKTTLEDIFANCQTISNHLANNPQTVGMIDYKLFSTMKDNATFINTGRGAQIVIEDLKRAMIEKPNATALIDVTDPTEPLPMDSDLWDVENIYFTPHRAGSCVNEVRRLGEYMFIEYNKVINSEPVSYEVTLDMLKTMA